jgi:hypothetical protein
MTSNETPQSVLLYFLVVLSCSKPPDATKDEPKQGLDFSVSGTASLSSTDLDPIRTTIGEKRVVMMGEAIRALVTLPGSGKD